LAPAPPSETFAVPDVEEHRMTFGEHLDDLRHRVFLAILGPFAGFIVCYVWFRNPLLHILLDPPFPAWRLWGHDILVLKAPKIELNPATPYTAFMTQMMVCLVAALILASPWVCYQIWAFVGSGLQPRERRFIKTYAPVSLFLFLAGVLFFYFVIYPVALSYLYGFGQDFNAFQFASYSDRIRINDSSFLGEYVNFVLLVGFVFGLMFETPLVILFLGRLGLVQQETFRRHRKAAILIIVIIAGLVTPPDAFSQIALSIPMYGLYELGILLLRLTARPDDAAA
jgi:sec-independent protein translocase protein TatC